MKRTKKFLTAMLAMTMAASLALPAFAVEDPNQMATIRLKTNEITTFADGDNDPYYTTTYNGYKLMNMTSSLKDPNPEAGHEHNMTCYNLSYTPNDIYADVMVDAANVVQGKGDEENPVTPITKDTLLSFLEGIKDDADKVRQFADAVWKGMPEKLKNAPDASVDTKNPKEVEQGYWLFADSRTGKEEMGGYTARSLVLLGTEGLGSLTISPKADVPEVDKQVSDDNKNWGEWTDVNIGDTVYFKLIGKNLPEASLLNSYETYSYTFHDTLSGGLKFNSDVSVWVVKGEDRINVTDAFTVTPNSEAGGTGSDLEIVISCDNIKNPKQLFEGKTIAELVGGNGEIVAEYSANLTVSADIGNPGNPNDVYLEYSNDPYSDGTGKTPEDEVVVFTYELEVVKVDGLDATVKLEGAEFVLYRENNGTAEYVQVDNDGKVIGWAAATTDADGKVTSYPEGSVLTTGKDGKINISGLDKGEYKLKETKAPNGYNLLKEDLEITIGAEVNDAEDELKKLTLTVGEKLVEIDPNNSDLNETEKANAVAGLAAGILTTNVENNTGSLLPETGGMGTTIFYIAGGVLMVGAAVLFVTKRRMGSAEK